MIHYKRYALIVFVVVAALILLTGCTNDVEKQVINKQQTTNQSSDKVPSCH